MIERTVLLIFTFTYLHIELHRDKSHKDTTLLLSLKMLDFFLESGLKSLQSRKNETEKGSIVMFQKVALLNAAKQLGKD